MFRGPVKNQGKGQEAHKDPLRRACLWEDSFDVTGTSDPQREIKENPVHPQETSTCGKS